MKKYAVITALLLAAAGSAHASRIDLDTSSLGGNAVHDFSSFDTLSFDMDISANAPIRLEFVRQSGDHADSISLSSMINNFSGWGWRSFGLTLSGDASFTQIGTVFGYAGLNDATASGAGSTASIVFDPTETAGFELGNVFGGLGIEPWVIDVSQLGTGGRFSLTFNPVAEVPLPAAAWLLGSALLGLGALRRRPA